MRKNCERITNVHFTKFRKLGHRNAARNGWDCATSGEWITNRALSWGWRWTCSCTASEWSWIYRPPRHQRELSWRFVPPRDSQPSARKYYYFIRTRSTYICIQTIQTYTQQDHQALPKAKYCPRVAADEHRKHQKNSCDLDLWPMTLKLNRVLEIVKVHVCAVYHQG